MSFNENDFYPSGAQGSSSSSSSSEPATPWLRKDELAEALEDIEEPPANATQKTIRQRLAGLIGRLKSLSPAAALALASFLATVCAAAGETIPWEEVPPDTPVDPAALLPVAESDPVFEAWTETNGYVKAENDPLGRYALRRTLAETNSASWAVVAGEGVELLDDGSVVAFTNEYIAAGDGFVVRSFDIVPVAPRAGVPLDAAIFEDWSAGSPDRGAILSEGPEVGIVPTNGILRVEVAFRRGELRYRVSRCILDVRSLSFGPADMAEAARDDLTADDYRFRDTVGEASLGNLRQWATDEFAAKSAEKWWQATAGGGVSLGGNTLTLGAGRFAQTLDADATNVLLTVGGQDALRVVDGYGLDADTNAEWRISDIRRTGTNVEVTVRCAMPGPWREAALWASRDFREWEETDFQPIIDNETWTYIVPTNTGYRAFKVAGTLVAHPDSRVETDFSVSAMGDVTASNGLHRLSAKADAAALAGYSPTGHVHAASDISGVAAQTWIFTLTNGVAITNEVLVREVAE